MRKVQFANGEYYHIFNRGVDKRDIFTEKEDILRFLQSMDEFNVIDPIGSIYENSFRKGEEDQLGSSASKLVEFVVFCLNPNHYHFILKQLVDRGIEKFMHKIGTGHTKFFNNKYERGGSLFQGRYKAVHINSNEYLLHVSAYVNLNDKVHGISSLGSSASKWVKSSWEEYLRGGGSNENNGKNDFCEKDIILDQFNNIEEYKEFAESSLIDIKERKDVEKFLLE